MRQTSLVFLCIVLNTNLLWSQGDKNFKSKLTIEQLTKAPAMLIPFPQQMTWDNEFVDIIELYVKEDEQNEGWGPPEEGEIPWEKEELYWTRAPSEVALKKGWNKVFVKIPCSSDFQNWMFTFIPLSMEGLSFSINSPHHSANVD